MQLATHTPEIRVDIVSAVRGIPRTAKAAATFPFAGFSMPVILDYWPKPALYARTPHVTAIHLLGLTLAWVDVAPNTRCLTLGSRNWAVYASTFPPSQPAFARLGKWSFWRYD